MFLSVTVDRVKKVLKNIQGDDPQDDVTGRCQFSSFFVIYLEELKYMCSRPLRSRYLILIIDK